MLLTELPVVDRIHPPISNKFVTGVELQVNQNLVTALYSTNCTSSGSDQSRSHTRPLSGTSMGRSSERN